MSDETTIRIDSEQYVVRPDGDGLQVGRRNGDDVEWLDTFTRMYARLRVRPTSTKKALSSSVTSRVS